MRATMTQRSSKAPVVPTLDSPDFHLENTTALYGDKIAALDGEIGHIRDFYFDDQLWVIRYAVADTGSWLTGRLVLLSPYAFGRLDQVDKTLHINLRKKQIQDSPSIESHKPVSRQFEADYYMYYGWPAYWDAGGDDKHLQSAREVAGYQLEALDGEIGKVTGFLVDDRTWAIRELVVETGHWYSGKEIRVPTGRVDRISYRGSKVHVNLTKASIQETEENELAT